MLLRDGALLAVWLETDGSVWLRRVSPEFTVTPALAVVPSGGASVRGMPRLALVRDYAGSSSSAELLVAFPSAGDRVGVVRVTVPEGELVASERACDACAPTAEELRGIPLRGRVVEANPAAAEIVVTHGEVPGVFPAGRRTFALPAAAFAELTTGAEFLGRVERVSGRWTLTQIQLLGPAVDGAPAHSGH